MPCRHALVLAVVAMLTSLWPVVASAAPPPIEVTTCGQEIPHGRSGYLTADLTCPAAGDVIAIRLGGGAKLDLQGHTLTGGVAAIACGDVQCDGANWCGPTRSSGKCEISNGTITGARYEAISGGNVVVRNMTIFGNDAYGVLAFHRVAIYDSHFANLPNGAQANVIIRTKNSTFDAAPLQARKVELESSTVSNGSGFGVAAIKVRLKSATMVTGNGVDPECGQPNTNCADIISSRGPWLDGTSNCGTSLRADSLVGNSPASWGVCLND